MKQHNFSRVVGVTLSFVLVGLLSLTAYAAGPAPDGAYQAVPAANHCAGISSDAAGSVLLAANPELSAACRFASMVSEKQETVDPGFPNIAGPEESTSGGTDIEVMRAHRYITAESGADMPDSTFAAANPEVMTARRYTTARSTAGLQQKLDTIKRFGLAEFLADEKDAASSQPLTIDDVRRIDLTEFMEDVEK